MPWKIKEDLDVDPEWVEDSKLRKRDKKSEEAEEEKEEEKEDGEAKKTNEQADR